MNELYSVLDDDGNVVHPDREPKVADADLLRMYRGMLRCESRAVDAVAPAREPTLSICGTGVYELPGWAGASWRGSRRVR